MANENNPWISFYDQEQKMHVLAHHSLPAMFTLLERALMGYSVQIADARLSKLTPSHIGQLEKERQQLEDTYKNLIARLAT